MSEKQANDLATLTAGVVSAYVGNHTVPVSDLPALVRGVYDALASTGEASAPSVEAQPTKASPAQIRKSITPDALISFEDGKPYKTLKRYLGTFGLTIEEYKAKWGLPADYPSVAPAYSEARSAMAKALGLGQGGRKGKARGKKA